MNRFRTIPRKTLRDLWRNRSRTLLVVLSVALGVLGVGMIVDTWDVLTTDLQRRYAAIHPADVEINAPGGIPVDDLKGLATIPHVTAVQGRAVYATRHRDAEGKWQALELLAFPDPLDQAVNIIEPEAGKWPPGRGEIVLERRTLPRLGLAVGDMLTVDAQGRELALHVVGTMHQQDNFSMEVRGTSTAVVDLDVMVQVQGHDRFNTIYLTVDSPQVRGEVAEAARQRLERAGHRVGRVTLKDPTRHLAQEVVDILLLIMAILGVLILLLSAFLVTNTISALITQQTDQIGIMKAIGGDRTVILVTYGLAVTIYGGLGTLLAIPLAGRLGYRLAAYLASQINIDLFPYRPSLIAWAAMIVVGLLIPLLAAAPPLWHGASITVQQAISSYGLGGGSGDPRLVRWLSRLQGLPRTWSLAIRNSVRAPSRLALTLITLTLAGATFVAVLSTRASFNFTLDNIVGNQYRIDAILVFTRAQRVSRVVPLLEAQPGVERAEAWHFDQVIMSLPSGQDVQATLIAGPLDTQLFRPQVEQGRWLREDDAGAIVLNQEWAQQEGVRLGDAVTVRVQGEDTTWTVVGFNRDLVEQRTGVYVDLDELNRALKRRDHTYTALVRYTAHDRASQEEITAQIIDALAAHGIEVFSAETMSAIRDQATAMYTVLVIFLLVMSLLLALVGGLGLMGAMSINVLERSKEIGVMRAIGADNRTLVLVFWGESMVITLASFLLAWWLSEPLARFMTRTVGLAFVNTPLDYAYARSAVGIWLVVAAVVGSLASIGPALNAARLRVQETLSYE
ncbi:MAG: ABC transporter permease [Caldilineae bacterium]|nr:MAG: ABC transporter permease [Caldilineae bacterium]